MESAMLDDLADLFGSTIRHAPANGFNGNGEATFGSRRSYPARVLYRARLIRSARGDQTVSRGEIWIAGTPHVGVNDQITLPDGSTPPILAVELLTDETGPSHAHVFFG